MNNLDPNKTITNVVFRYERLEQENHILRDQVEFYRTELENLMRDYETHLKRTALRCANELEELHYEAAADIVSRYFGVDHLQDEGENK